MTSIEMTGWVNALNPGKNERKNVRPVADFLMNNRSIVVNIIKNVNI